MGRKKIAIEKIQDSRLRIVSYYQPLIGYKRLLINDKCFNFDHNSIYKRILIIIRFHYLNSNYMF